MDPCLWPYLPPLFWSRNSMAGSTISNWIGVPGAMSCVESWMPADSLGIILSFSIFFTVWLKWKWKKNYVSIHQWHPTFALEGRWDYSKIQSRTEPLCRNIRYFPIYLLLRTVIKSFFNLILFRTKVTIGILNLNADQLWVGWLSAIGGQLSPCPAHISCIPSTDLDLCQHFSLTIPTSSEDPSAPGSMQLHTVPAPCKAEHYLGCWTSCFFPKLVMGVTACRAVWFNLIAAAYENKTEQLF